ncbi:two-component response regulator-like PRR37 [Rhodamnia argentea]|uniref:Two-component response regulator-like PRR37 n=1 Tax=Rhodamnia argentea TaxID=178133 RepID=A0A8B8QEQ5_9MYRT|nr:two-component response regulator-like PRR37 [Rhodamnia argentea]XP_030544673.1 two-component response regulator-like PRR37 [Rhodamnia argentea]XP_030544682.1 two-component response regulator-like PRR37 [Rhodamnia argentea]
MPIVLMTNNRPGTKGLAEENHHKNDENKYRRDGVTGDGQELAEEDELQINEDVEGALNRKVEEIQTQDLVHGHSVIPRMQQSEESLVHWERFLPLRSLKVLLVEYDDSTRQVVTALLRNCGYEVTAVANGLQAWKVLEDRSNNIDLVLAEVAMPSFSGIGLLCKIMSHKSWKNIPVIMMSSHDSMSVVFKCLSKGAVDFLVKPIRKNELKNLWQHVWRKCHSSSGSGSESGIRTQKSTKSNGCEDSDNNTGSNDEDDIESIGVRDGSDNGSGTQSSWTKKAVEIDSPRKASSWEQLADPLDSTCAQVMHTRPDTLSSNWVPMTAMRNAKGKYDELGLVPFQDKDMMRKDLEIGAPNLQTEEPSKNDKITTDPTANETSEVGYRKNNEQLENRQLELNSEKPNAKTGAVTNGSNPPMQRVNLNIGNGLSKVSDVNDKAAYDTKEMPSLELSLKRMKDDVESNPHGKNILRHSGLSAFSRYNYSTPNQTPTGNVGSCSSADNCSEVDKTEYLQNFRSNSSSPPQNQGSNGSSNNNDVGSTTNNAFTKVETVTDKPPSKSMLKYLHQSSAFQPLQNSGTCPQPAIEGIAEPAMAHMIVAQARGMKHHVQVQHHHHHYHLHHHHHAQNVTHMQEPAKDHDMVSESTPTAAPQCGSSDVLSTPYEGIVANNSCNRSASGSNHASNGQNGRNLPTNDQETNMDGDNKVAEESGANSGIGYTNRNGVEQSRNAQREAALNKFRQKRKERCFEKKVRYHSRKKLAEQRPRIRGQFVRQAVNEIKGQETSS